ncbi:hypothetical protein WH52_11625 [Tenacibaculum holothuriorum]|uniref:Activator of Hsp90 ATPase homologue 1/2-like C-terminal domain-containing protein n=1 Tax=Tenacibaculum holothuriorum TaxID=1635173 RepID=A0A1Y2PAM2_9FLAO|nr:SRPBCC domain-containing protein [Tenacibaculum holothuriorum]OSY87506.1 hypothetical protein WH52_11625 [Tenacibaculum holothuriorum]
MKPVIVTRIINKSKSEVWNTITNHSKMIQWFFNNIPDFKPEVGFTTEFNVNSGERNFLHVWRVTEVNPQNKIVCEWKYPEYVDKSLWVTFELKKISTNSTEFKVEALGIEYFESFNIPEFKRESCEGGWSYFSDNLKSYLEK